MADIYDQHQAAFSNVSAFAVVRDGQQCGKVAFKFPKDGAGRLFAYVHWHGVNMVRAFAGGCGYDKKSAAIANAVRKISGDGWNPEWQAEFIAALEKDDGNNWDNNLRKAGFDLFQAV